MCLISLIPTRSGASAAAQMGAGVILKSWRYKVTPPSVTKEEINSAFRRAAQGRLGGIMGICDEPLVSGDFVGSPYSCVVDVEFTHAVGDDLSKVVAWYDNEMGYAARLVDVVSQVLGAEL